MPNSVQTFLGAIFTLFLIYAVMLIYGSSFTVAGEQWYALFDDAMISMRYARHLADGNGLVWNPGERVEGFTNPGRTLIMAAVHMVEPRENITSLYVQVISAFFLSATIVMTALLGLRINPARSVVAATAAAATAFYFPLNYFSLMGMETGLLAFLIAAAMYLLVRAGQGQRSSPGAWALLAAAIFVRLDAVVPALSLTIAILFLYPMLRRSTCIAAAVVIGGSLAIQTALRLWYYGDPLPNTYYLKMSEVPLLTRIGRGLWVTSRFTVNHLWPFLLMLPFAAIYAMRHESLVRRQLRSLFASPILLPLGVAGGQIVYSTYVGGDVWEWFLYANRFHVIAAPAMFILIAQLTVWLLSRVPAAARALSRFPATSSIILTFLLILLSNWHGAFAFARDQALLRRPLYGVNDAAAFVAYAQHIKATEPRTTTIAIDRAGTLPYFLHDYQFYDMLGKCDPVIAKSPSRDVPDPASAFGNTFVPGHTKWDASHTIGHLHPDLVIFTADFTAPDFASYLRDGYTRIENHGLPGSVYRRK